MFGFFKKRQEKQVVKKEPNAAERFMQEAKAGTAKPLELALAIHDKEPGNESFARLIMTLPYADLYVLNAGKDRFGDVAMFTRGETTFLALFTSRELATVAISPPYEVVQEVSALELLFLGSAKLSWIFNPGHPVISGLMSSSMIDSASKILADINIKEGMIYTVWTQNCYRAVRILKTDEIGVHFRLYSAGWSERPTSLTPADLEDRDSGLRGFGHLPLTRQGFLQMGPKPVSGTEIPMQEKDLEGYQIWLEAKGGYFDKLN